MDAIRPHPTFVVLGDSAAFGTGDEVSTGSFVVGQALLLKHFKMVVITLIFQGPVLNQLKS